jgi:hypothetical protein
MARIFYVISTPHLEAYNLYKLGMTSNLHKRLQTYMTSCPPFSQFEMRYILWSEPKFCTDVQSYELDAQFKKYFMHYRIVSVRHTEWHQISHPLLRNEFDTYMKSIGLHIYEKL